MIMRVVVPIITALILIAVGAFWMFTMLIGTNGYSGRKGGAILVGNLVLVIITIIISSIASGWLAHVLQKRSGLSPWLVAPISIVSVTVVAFIALFLIGALGIIIVADVVYGRGP